MSVRALAIVTTVLAAIFGVGGCGSDAPEPPGAARTVDFAGPEGNRLAGRALGRGTTAVVLVHGASTTMASWYSVMGPLARAGYRVVAFNARGVGESDGSRIDDPDARAADLAAVVHALRDDGVERVVVAGSSLGSLAVIDYAAGHRVAAAVVVSPPGVPSEASRVSAPMQIITSRDDTGPAAAARALGTELGVRPVVVNGGIHGADLFRSHPEAIRALVRFVSDHVPVTR